MMAVTGHKTNADAHLNFQQRSNSSSQAASGLVMAIILLMVSYRQRFGCILSSHKCFSLHKNSHRYWYKLRVKKMKFEAQNCLKQDVCFPFTQTRLFDDCTRALALP